MKKVLVLDADQRSCLAVTRSLGKRNIFVFTAEASNSALASQSKYSTGHFSYPSPKQQPEQFIEALSKFVEQHNIEIIIPMTELTTMLLLLNQQAFPNVTLPFSDIHAVDTLTDKCKLMQIAEQLDIPIPHTLYIENLDTIFDNLNQLNYPIVLKPGKSWLFYEGKWNRAEVKFAGNPEEAKKILTHYWAFKAHEFMIQECISGYGEGVFAIYNKGEELAFFAHRRLREKPPSGGVSVLSQSIDVNPALKEQAKKLLENSNWHGVAMVEFKIDHNGTPYLMEINTRFWGSLQLAIDAGIDFPHLLYQLACGQQPKSVTTYKTNLRLRWLLGDLDNLYLTWKSKTVSFIEKIKASLRFFLPSLQTTRHEINRLNDLSPALYELKSYILDLLGKKTD